MKLKDRAKTYSFWVSLTSAVILIIKLIGQKYGLAIDETFISDLVTTICGLLVILGIIVIPKTEIITENKNIQTSNINNADNQPEKFDNDDKPELSNETLISELTTNEISEESQILQEDKENNFNEPYVTNTQCPETISNIEISNNSNENNFDEIKNHIHNTIKKDKEIFNNNFNTYKQLLIDEINNFDE